MAAPPNTAQPPTVPYPRFTDYSAIVKSDTVDLVKPADGIWVGGAGVVVAVKPDGTAVSFTCVAGTLLPIYCIRVNSTNTTATLMVACNW